VDEPADAIDEMRIRSKIRTVEDKNSEYNSLLVFIVQPLYFSFFTFLFSLFFFHFSFSTFLPDNLYIIISGNNLIKKFMASWFDSQKLNKTAMFLLSEVFIMNFVWSVIFIQLLT
jgi:hypothetical protein